MIRTFLNSATRKQNMATIKQKGGEAIYHMLQQGLKDIKEFEYLLVYMFQEVVVDALVCEIYNKLTSLEHGARKKVLREIVERYMMFSQLGYVFVIKNHLDTYSC